MNKEYLYISLTDPPTICIWTYNALYHLISENSSGSTPPPISGQLLVQMFITKEEEKAIGISEQKTVEQTWRRKNNIPDSNKIELVKTLTQFQQPILIVMTINWKR